MRFCSPSACVLTTLAGVALAAVPSVANAAHKSGTGLRVKGDGWIIHVSGTTTKAPPNATVVYCESQRVETVTPRLILTGAKSRRYYYAYHMRDPRHRRSTNLFASFVGKRQIAETPFQPLEWTKAEARESEPLFLPGIYKVELSLGGRIKNGLLAGGKMTPVETMRLKPKKGC